MKDPTAEEKTVDGGRRKSALVRNLMTFLAMSLAIGIGGYLAALQPGSGGREGRSFGPQSPASVADGGNDIDRLSLSGIDFDMSVSPIPGFDLTTLDVGPSLPRSVLTDIRVNDSE